MLSLERSLMVQLWDADELGADVLLGEVSRLLYCRIAVVLVLLVLL